MLINLNLNFVLNAIKLSLIGALDYPSEFKMSQNNMLNVSFFIPMSCGHMILIELVLFFHYLKLKYFKQIGLAELILNEFHYFSTLYDNSIYLIYLILIMYINILGYPKLC